MLAVRVDCGEGPLRRFTRVSSRTLVLYEAFGKGGRGSAGMLGDVPPGGPQLPLFRLQILGEV